MATDALSYTKGVCRSSPIGARVSKDDHDFLIGVMDEEKIVLNYLLKMVMSFRQQKYTMNNVVHDGAKEFEDLCIKHNVNKHDLSSLCKDFYNYFVSEGQVTNTVYGIIFDCKDKEKVYKQHSKANKSDKANKSNCDGENVENVENVESVESDDEALAKAKAYNDMHPANRFKPIKNAFFKLSVVEDNGVIVDLTKYYLKKGIGGFFQNIVRQLETVMGSYYQKDKNYQEQKDKWVKIVESENDPKVLRYSDFIYEFASDKYFNNFGAKNYDNFIKNWKDFISSKTDTVRVGLRTKLLEVYKTHGPEYVFRLDNRDCSMCYSEDLLNLIYHKYRDLWLDKDDIGDDEKVSKILKSYHWLKENVNLSLFGTYGKLPAILLGENYVKFSGSVVNSDNGVINLKFIVRGKEINIFTKSNGYLRGIEFKNKIKKNDNPDILDSDESDNNVINGKYIISYCSDSKLKTRYEAQINEPKVRYNAVRKQFELDMSMVNIKCMEDKAKFMFKNGDVNFTEDKMRIFFNTAYENSVWNKVTFDMHVMGVDLGVTNPFVATIARVRKNIDSDVLVDTIYQGKNYQSENFENTQDLCRKFLFNCETAIKLIRATKKVFIDNNSSFGGVTKESFINPYSKRQLTDGVLEGIGVNFDEYVKSLHELPLPSYDGCPHYIAYWLNVRDYDWVQIKRLLNRMSQDFKKIKAINSNDTSSANNVVDGSVFQKMKCVKMYIDLQSACGKSRINTNEIPSLMDGTIVGKKLTGSYLSNLWDYYNGLTRHVKTYTSAAIVNLARKHNVKMIVLEDLSKGSNEIINNNSSKDNFLSSLWAPSNMLKWIVEKARKHEIIVKLVNPHLTSQVDSETQDIGERIGRELIVNRNGKEVILDADLNASLNILKQGVNAETYISSIPIVEVGNNEYHTAVSKTKIKQGFLRRAFNIDKGKDIKFSILEDKVENVSVISKRDNKTGGKPGRVNFVRHFDRVKLSKLTIHDKYVDYGDED